jgi:hypothetical protein
MHNFVYPLKKLPPFIFQNAATISQWKPTKLRLDDAAPTLEQWLAPLAQRGNSASSVVV